MSSLFFLLRNIMNNQNSSNISAPNDNEQCNSYLSDGNKVGLTLVYVFSLIAAITGNSFVIHIVRTQKKMKVSFNYLVVNMAIADIINAMSSMPLSISFIHKHNKWFSGLAGDFFCKLSNFLVVAPILVSLATLIVITVERYLATTRVLKRPLSTKAVKRLIAGIWIVTSLMSVHEFLKMEVIQGHDGFYYCALSDVWAQRLVIEYVIKFVVTYAFPLLTMIILYSLIVCLLWKKQTIGEDIDDYNRRFLKQKKGVIIKLVIIVLVFAFCWFPVHVNHLMAAFNYQLFTCVPSWVVLSLYWLAHANSAINPFLYLMLTKNSRALFKAHISGIIRGDGSSGKGSNKSKDKNHRGDSIMFWRRGMSKKTTRTVII